MTAITFFLTVFCGIFGAYILSGLIFNALTAFFAKERTSNAGKQRRIHNNKRDG